jgi:hypothetical protein
MAVLTAAVAAVVVSESLQAAGMEVAADLVLLLEEA